MKGQSLLRTKTGVPPGFPVLPLASSVTVAKWLHSLYLHFSHLNSENIFTSALLFDLKGLGQGSAHRKASNY